MATYAIGDIQGCMGTLARLLETLEFRPKVDHLVVVGDLVNRGPHSAQALRWAKNLGDSLTMVLGNHDLALLAVAAGVRPMRAKDTFGEVLAAHDSDELLAWLRARPFACMREGHLVVHAGVLPDWSTDDALQHGQAAHEALMGPHSSAFLAALETHATADSYLYDAIESARVLTYLRVLQASGTPHYTFKGPLTQLPEGHHPWFTAPTRQTRTTPILCGHWAALGLHQQDNISALDTGCVWGGKLTALRLHPQAIVQVPYSETVPPLASGND